MRVRGLAGLALLLVSHHSAAEVPITELEQLRRATIVTRAAADGLATKELRKCGQIVVARVGAGLALLTANSEAGWSEKTLAPDDIPILVSRISKCEARGSCSVYKSFLTQVKVPPNLKSQVDELLANLETRLPNLSSASYVLALKTLPNPCKELRRLR